MPLNSRRVTRSQLRAVAEKLGLPTSATGEDLAQIVSGKLTEEGRDPKNVQIVLSDDQLQLEDVDGVFLTVTLEEEAEEHRSELEQDSEGEEEGEFEDDRPTNKEFEQLQAEKEDLERRLAEKEAELQRQTARYAQLWRLNCDQLGEFDCLIEEKEAQVRELTGRIQQLEGLSQSSPVTVSPNEVTTRVLVPTTTSQPGLSVLSDSTVGDTPGTRPLGTSSDIRNRKGKAPPVDPFTGDPKGELNFDDWLPTLERAATWNQWTEEEQLLQLAGHLRGRAFREWNLMSREDRQVYSRAVKILRERVDMGQRALAAQDFRHLHQRDNETVGDFIGRLERTFQLAYGADVMAEETRQRLLQGQLQEGLKDEILKSPTVLGSLDYNALCLAAKNEERRLTQLSRRQHQRTSGQPKGASTPAAQQTPSPAREKAKPKPSDSKPGVPLECFNCGRRGHLKRNCPHPSPARAESRGKSNPQPKASTHSVSTAKTEDSVDGDNPLDFLYSYSDDQTCLIQIKDQGSSIKHASVVVQGVPCEGVIDTGSDITIIGGKLFKKIAVVARLCKRDFRPADKTPIAYGRQPFTLHGKMSLSISFEDREMVTPVYIKMDSEEPLLLAEGVCRQLQIVKYHPEVLKSSPPPIENTKPDAGNMTDEVSEGQVTLVHTVTLLPHQSANVPVQSDRAQGTQLLESQLSQTGDVIVRDGLLEFTKAGRSGLTITNTSDRTRRVKSGTVMGATCQATIEVLHSEGFEERTTRRVSTEDPDIRKRWLADLLNEQDMALDESQRKLLVSTLTDMHEAFCLQEGERGETELVQFHINTGDAEPKRQPPRRVPFAVRGEINEQLAKMQAQGVIHPSTSPWASPVVLVRKKDGTLRFCVDYRALNAVTKPDVFPIPRIDDLLDQLGQCTIFSTLDLAAGYWQIKVHPDSQEKTAFTTHQGLYEFSVMPFGLRNAPATFQRTMQEVLRGLNPEKGPDFVSVYIDDVLIFSRNLEEHVKHIQQVVQRVADCGLKLKPNKCHFARRQVEFLGHVVTAEGLKPNAARVEAVSSYPVPANIKEVRQFLGLASYYRRFVPCFAKIAAPLHHLLVKGKTFNWTPECQQVFEDLKGKLVNSPVLAFPDFDRSFVLETDASIRGLGAVLSQKQSDGKFHPVAYASCSLSKTEERYSITDLETLAVVWAISHFQYYLYGHDVTVRTDHQAVKAILGSPNASGKHACWWSKVYSSGLRTIDITYRPGKENTNADALSRQPCQPSPEDNTASHFVQVASILEEVEDAMMQPTPPPSDFSDEQWKDAVLGAVIDYLTAGTMPPDNAETRRLITRSSELTLVEGVLYHFGRN